MASLVTTYFLDIFSLVQTPILGGTISTMSAAVYISLLLLCTVSAFPQYQADSKTMIGDSQDSLSREKRQSGRKPGKRQAGGSLGVNTAANCDFKRGGSVDTCLWDNLANYTALQWGASKGEDAYWVGGPRKDKNDDSLEGGYAFLETSSLPEEQDKPNQVSAMMESPLLTSTGSKGHCVTFSYSISGLSADRLRVLLHPVSLDTDPDTPSFSNDVVLATLIDDTMGEWRDAQVMYTFPEEHTVRQIHTSQSRYMQVM